MNTRKNCIEALCCAIRLLRTANVDYMRLFPVGSILVNGINCTFLHLRRQFYFLRNHGSSLCSIELENIDILRRNKHACVYEGKIVWVYKMNDQ